MKQRKYALTLLGLYLGYKLIKSISFHRVFHAENENPVKATVDKPANCLNDVLVKKNNHILKAIFAYDNSKHKSMVHVRFDQHTLETMNRFKMAAKVDMTKLVAFAVNHLFENQPELTNVIRLFLQNTKL